MYIDYPYEEVMFITDGIGNRYVKFYGKPETDLNPESDLFWDAVRQVALRENLGRTLLLTFWLFSNLDFLRSGDFPHIISIPELAPLLRPKQ
jgi:hypothetical protein